MSNTKLFGKKGWTPERIGSLKGKTFLITGATSGTGFEASKILLSKGAKVVMLNRNSQKSEDVIGIIKKELGSNADVSYIQMDLAEQASAIPILAHYGKNILTVMQISPLELPNVHDGKVRSFDYWLRRPNMLFFGHSNPSIL